MTISVSFQMFIFSHSTFDVGRSMFDVHFFSVLFQSLLGKNNLALMETSPFPDINTPFLLLS
jgi:hypothetical protein